MTEGPDFAKKDPIAALLRDLGMIIPGKDLAGPDAAAPPPVAHQTAPAADRGAADRSQTVFAAGCPAGQDALGVDATLVRIAGLAAHARIETPLTIGLLGPSGCGKSFALTRLLRAIELLSTGAAAAPDFGPFAGSILTLRIDASHIEGSPATSLAAALHTRLAEAFPACAAEAARAIRDPRADARDALERLDESRRKLEAEKRALDEANAQRARLAETILYQTAGSQIDTFVSTHKDRIKRLLLKLGDGGDPLLAFKDMTRTLAGTDGFARRAGFVLQALFAFRGQRKLLASSALMFLAGAGLRLAFESQSTWLGWRRANDSAGPVAAWLEAHIDMLSGLPALFFLGGAMAFGLALWRALRLCQRVFRGEALLRADVIGRGREMDRLLAHQTRRVEALASDVNIYSRLAAEAERRAGSAQGGSLSLAEPPPFASGTALLQAHAYLAAAGAMAAASSQAAPSKNSGILPHRIVVAIDHLDAVPVPRGREILDHARSLLQQGYVVLIAADPARLADRSGNTPQLDKWVQVPVQIGVLAARADHASFVHAILDGGAGQEPPIPSATTSELDRPISADEAQLLAGLAPLAGASARALKRFVNLYRLLRTQSKEHDGALALMLAIDAGGTPAEIAVLNDALSNTPAGARFALQGVRLNEAVARVQGLAGEIPLAAARGAAEAARVFTFNA